MSTNWTAKIKITITWVSKVWNRMSCTTKIPSSKPIWDTKLCNKSPRWILKMGFSLHTILYLATKIHLQNPPGIQNHATKNRRWSLKMGFCLLHMILHLATKKPIFKNPSAIQNYGFWSTGFCCTQFCIWHFWRWVFVVLVGLMEIFQLYTFKHSLRMCKSFYSIAMEGIWSSKYHVPRDQISSEVILWNTLQASLMEPPTFDIHVLNKVYYSTKSSESQPLLTIICSWICLASSIATTLTYTFMFMRSTRRLVKLGHALREMEQKHTCEESCILSCWNWLSENAQFGLLTLPPALTCLASLLLFWVRLMWNPVVPVQEPSLLIRSRACSHQVVKPKYLLCLSLCLKSLYNLHFWLFCISFTARNPNGSDQLHEFLTSFFNIFLVLTSCCVHSSPVFSGD